LKGVKALGPAAAFLGALLLALPAMEGSAKETRLANLKIFLGDSLTEGHDWARAFPPAVNLGFGGDTCGGVWARLGEVVGLDPDEIFLQIGINDFLRGAPPEEILAGHLRIWGELADRLPRARLRVVSMLPYLEASLPGLPPNRELILLNAALAEEAGRRGLVFIDLFRDLADEDNQLRLDCTSDGLHLTPLAYKIWADKLKDIMGGPS
jgi:lysophospholipase L1-like esterase